MKSVTINGLKDITIKDLTGGEIAGSGNFDEMMRTVKSNMEVEFAANRITGGDYANAYTALMQSTMQNAVHYTLSMNKVNADVTLTNLQNLKLEKELEILEQQLLLLKSQVNLSYYQEAIQLNASTQGVLDTNALAQGQIGLIKEQTAGEIAKTSLLIEQELTQEQQTLLATHEVTKASEAVRTVVDPLRGETVAPLYSAHAMTEQGLLKIAADVSLTAQKNVTEQAQTRNPGDYTPGTGQEGDDAKNSGLVGKQMALYAQQREGFKRDAEQKAAKLYVDTWSVAVNATGTAGTPRDAGLGLGDVKEAMAHLDTGHNIPPSTPVVPTP